MEYKNLGNSGLQVSAVGLGGNNFGDKPRVAGLGVDAAGTTAVINQALDEGITFFDSADFYGGGKSEEYIGRALKPHRRNVVLATKVSGWTGEGPYWRGSSRKYLTEAVEASLRRLDTDYIDLLQIHAPDPATPIEETLRFLDELVRAGKVHYIGNCNFFGWQIGEAEWVARTEHLTHFISVQNQFNIMQRSVEVEIAPTCQRYGLSLIPFSPLASGFLTGKYRPHQTLPEGGRLSDASTAGSTSPALSEGNFELLAKLEKFAQERGHTILELAISWLTGRPFVGTVIAGATKPEQVSANAKAAAWKLTSEEYAEIDEITDYLPVEVLGMHAASGRYKEPSKSARPGRYGRGSN
jgi:aryl-alcohol dehydrogenase-like predicted oxidoreductase